MKSTTRCLLIAVTVMMAACGHDAPARAPAPTEPAAPEALPVAQERIPEAASSLAPERVTFTTEDGVTIVGTLRRSAVRGATAVVFVHQLSSNRAEWEPVVEQLSAPPGLTTLSIDLRGHGESTAGPNGALDWQSFQQADFEAMSKDVAAAAAFLRVDEQAAPNRIELTGASIGSTAVLRAAADDEALAAAVAVVSPGRAYRGIDAITPASRLGNTPLLTIAAQGETVSVQAAQDMARVAGSGRYVASTGSAHGVRQFAESPASLAALIAFLRDPAAEASPTGGAQPAPEGAPPAAAVSP